MYVHGIQLPIIGGKNIFMLGPDRCKHGFFVNIYLHFKFFKKIIQPKI